MNRNTTFKALALAISMTSVTMAFAEKYEYPFQNPKLPEEKRIDNLISLMTIDEKLESFVGGGVPRLGVPAAGSTEAIHGIVRGGATTLPPLNGKGEMVRTEGMINSTAFPQAYGLGETWDRALIEKIGEIMSIEARYYSQNNEPNYLCLWAPNADLARDPRWGRTEESFGEDPFLVGELVVAETKGIQGNDPKYWRGAAIYKHFLANSNEDGRSSTSSDFDEALFRDYYSYGFWRGARDANGESLMCAYNKYNGVPCSTHDFIHEILQDEWGMDGMMLNDGSALTLLMTAHHWVDDMKQGVKAILEAGISRILERAIPNLKAAYEEGYIDEMLINKNIRGNLRTMLRLGLLDKGGSNPYADLGLDTAPWETQENKDWALLAQQKSMVLLKNENQLLPIDKSKVKKIAVFGNRAETVIKDWYGALPTYTVSPLDGIRNAVKESDVEVKFMKWDFDGKAQELAQWADVCIVVLGNDPLTSPDWGNQTVQAPWAQGGSPSDGREAVDRRSLQLDTEDLVKVIHQANPNTVLALISSFPYTINWSAEHLPAIVHCTQCCQELGTGLADVLFGNYNPAGRLSQTWVKEITDLPNMLDYDIRHGRTYMYFKGEPLYPFGFGLSYTQFDYANLTVEHRKGEYAISFDLTNTGNYDGEEVAQLYVKFSGDDAIKRLRGFERIAVKQGETRHVTLTVPDHLMTLWDAQAHAFRTPAGPIEYMVGASSADIRLRGSL